MTGQADKEIIFNYLPLTLGNQLQDNLDVLRGVGEGGERGGIQIG